MKSRKLYVRGVFYLMLSMAFSSCVSIDATKKIRATTSELAGYRDKSITRIKIIRGSENAEALAVAKKIYNDTVLISSDLITDFQKSIDTGTIVNVAMAESELKRIEENFHKFDLLAKNPTVASKGESMSILPIASEAIALTKAIVDLINESNNAQKALLKSELEQAKWPEWNKLNL